MLLRRGGARAGCAPIRARIDSPDHGPGRPTTTESVMKPTMLAFAMMALFALTACGGGGGGGGSSSAAQPSTPSRPIDDRYISDNGRFSATWDGMAISTGYRGGAYDMPSNATLPSPVPSRFVFEDALALAAVSGDRALTEGEVDIWIELPDRELWFDFQFPGTRLDPYFTGLVHNVRRTLTGWQWQDSEGQGSLIRTSSSNNAPTGIYGVERYDNSAGQEVNAAYFGKTTRSVTPPAPRGAPPNTDPTLPQPLPPPPAPGPIDWSFDSGNLSVAWDGMDISIGYARGSDDTPINAVVPPYVPSTLTFTGGSAWGAIAGDRTPARGDVDIVLSLSTRRMAFDFDFPGTRLDSPIFARQLTGWQWQDSDGAGSLIGDFVGVYGVESYDNSAGVEVQAAYRALADR